MKCQDMRGCSEYLHVHAGKPFGSQSSTQTPLGNLQHSPEPLAGGARFPIPRIALALPTLWVWLLVLVTMPFKIHGWIRQHVLVL